MKTIGYAIVGVGYFGAELGRIMNEQEGPGGGRPGPGKRGDHRQREYGCDVETDLDTLCARADVDAVLVATPNYLHKEPVLTAARHKSMSSVKSPWPCAMPDCDEWYGLSGKRCCLYGRSCDDLLFGACAMPNS